MHLYSCAWESPDLVTLSITILNFNMMRRTAASNCFCYGSPEKSISGEIFQKSSGTHFTRVYGDRGDSVIKFYSASIPSKLKTTQLLTTLSTQVGIE